MFVRKQTKPLRDGFNILILSDRNVSNDRIAIPALLASSATHEFLVHEGNRTKTGLVVDTGSAREVHHFALLGGYGAEAICPWLVFETMKEITDDADQAQTNFIKAVGKGLYKIMSKMGISTFQSYCGAQIFEAIGLNSKFIEKYFTGTTTNIEGIGLAEVSAEAEKLHSDAFGNDPVSSLMHLMLAVSMPSEFVVSNTCGIQNPSQNCSMPLEKKISKLIKNMLN